MKPIINPWIMYIIGLIYNINIVFSIIFIVLLSIFILILFGIIVTFVDNYTIDEIDSFLDDYHDFIKWFKRGCVALVITGTVLILMPSEKTLYSMVVLDNVTPNNIETIGNTGKDVVDYIFDKIDQMNEEENE